MMEKIIGIARVGMLLAALHCAAWAGERGADARKAKVTDESGAESQVSGLMVTNIDLRFGFQTPDDQGRIVVATRNLELAIPLPAISSITRAGGTNWVVKYQTKDGEATAAGGLVRAVLAGNSEFGSFSLPLARLNRLEYAQPGSAAAPARRVGVFDQDGHPRAGSFDAVLTLTDGTRLPAAQLRRNEVYAQSVTDPMVVPVRPSYAIVCTNFTDFRLLRGETLQTIPFENARTVEFLNENVLVRAVSGAEATMTVPRRADEMLEGFNGASSKGDFYVPLKFVRSIAFGADAK
jgi:hypothetical protein